MSTVDDEVLRVEQIAKALFRLTLTRSNRADILSYGASRLDDNQEEAELLLGNLQRWVPGEIAGSFARRSAAAVLEDTPLRVICSSQAGVPFDSGFCIRQYLAVSYCWHDAKWPPKPPPGDGPGSGAGRPKDEVTQPWPIFGRFAKALLKERGHPREGIWMDQLCINQDDNAEKQRAIAAMDIIYKSCRKLVVLLEDVELSEDELRIFESDKYDLSYGKHDVDEDPASLDEKDLPAFLSFLGTIARARWWQRAWCFHEFIVIEPWSDKRHYPDHKTVFIMGSPDGGTVSIPFLAVQRVIALAIRNKPHGQPIPPGLTPHLVGLSNQISPYRDELKRKTGSMRASISGQYNAVASTGCTIATDRLAVMINLSGLSITYIGRAASKEEVYFLGVALALAAGEESPLSYIGSKDVIVYGRPSWVSWSGAPEDLPPPSGDLNLLPEILPRFTLKTLPGIHRFSIYELELDMIFFDSAPHQATEEEIRATDNVFPDRIIRSTVPPRMIGMTPERLQHLDEELNPLRRAFLALAMGLEPSCVGRLWTAIYRDIVKVKFDQGMFDALEPNQDLLPQAEAFLSHISTLDNGERIEEHTGQTFDLKAATFFLTWLTDPRTFDYVGLLPSRLQCAVAGAQALTSNATFNSHFSSSDLREIRGAIPTALVGSSCLPLRMWLLKPVQINSHDGDGIGGDNNTVEPPRWRVVGKAMLLGEPDLNAELDSHCDGGVLTLKTNQVIVG